MERITKTELSHRLDHALGKEVGMEGLNILLSGWKNKRHFGSKYRHALNARPYLFITEVLDFSEYIGYDLTKKSSQ